MTEAAWVAVVYLAGVAVGLLAVDAPPAARVGLALAWPIGPAAFIVTIAGLGVVAALAYPVVGVVVAALGVAAWLWLGG